MEGSKRYDGIPDFLIIGAGKSGTTSLDNYLKQHPQIFIPSLKEPNFFGYELTKIEDLNGDPQEINHFKSSVTTLGDYLSLFASASPSQLKGETSNTYLYHEKAPERIQYYNPNIKLIAVFRQPADRLYSRYLHLARVKKLPSKNFEDCLNEKSIWWKRNDLIKEGFYYKNLSRFYNYFPAENIRIYLYEELNKNTETVLKDVFHFLQIDHSIEIDTTIRYNQSGFVKNQFLDSLYGGDGLVQKTMKAILPSKAITRLKANISIQRALNSLKNKNLERPKIDPKVREILTHKIYGDDIRNLERLINKDLTRWLK
ncbi:MAG: sulfotransferase domain-containing protein [Cyclobacteriaceae bacterium]|nr:sulfotransferase domain-containing protein [Cyclobacteriaceae bacterium]